MICNRPLQLWAAEHNEMTASAGLFAAASGEQALNAVDLGRVGQRKS